ncbi:MAG TPA: Gfo/Idh/MocA family oxidoreductase [Solirubrobacteraceae bacterium]|nr:Gfo/Idh/MocA family oxidoreductase [Solirubrobacteraceae bacterium]
MRPPASPGGAPRALRVGLIGAGWISESHLPHIEADGDTRLVAVCDTDLARAEAISRPRGASAYVGWEEMLDADRLDAVWVCTPPLHHRAPTVAALERGIHVYLEKPIARDLSEGEVIVAAAEAAEAVCVVGYQWRGTELLQRAQELVSPRDVAMLVSRNYGPVAARGWFMDPQQSGGQILERASHHIDLQRAIGGEVVAVRTVGSSVALAQAGQPSATIEDALALTLEFATGAVGTIGVAWTPPDHPSVHALDVMAAQASINLRLGPGSFDLGGVAAGDALSGSYGDPMRRSVRRFLDLARGERDIAPFCTPRDALGTLAVALACERALASGERVTVPGSVS